MTNPSIPCIAQTFKAGDKLAGCYTLKEALAPQGFCFVWLAHDEELNKDIVLHFVPDSVAADSRAMSELKQEAKRNRQLIHPRIIRVHDLVEEEKWAAISMDHIPDETYAALQKKRDKRAFNPSEVSSALAELCQTIEDAHRIDLFHRDLTLENILATGNGVMVQKFGISRVILDSLARGGHAIQASRDIACISPQQLDGERPSRADDIYTLGASIFDLLTGTPPFHEGDMIPQIRKNVPPLVSERRAALKIGGDAVPKAWDDVIAACLAKNPEERPKSAAEVGSRLASAKPGAAAGGAAAAAAATAAGVAAAAQPNAPGEAKDGPKTPSPGQEAKSQKRPWAPGPGKAPVITEATVLSKTPVPKAETKGESKAEAKAESKTESARGGAPGKGSEAGGAAKKAGPGPTTPTGFPLRAFVEVEGAPARSKGKSSAGLIAAGVVLLLILIVGYLVSRNNQSPNPAPENIAATTGSNSVASGPASETTPPPNPVEAASNVPLPVNSTPAPLAAAPTPAPGPVEAGSPAPSLAALAAMTDAQAQQLLADKTSAVDQARAALADAQKAAQAAAAAQTQTAAAVQELQAPVQQKADAAAAAKKAADAAAATLKQQQDALQKAQADADAAQKAAAAKAQAADQARQTVQDAQAAAQQQQAALKQAQADADQVAKTLADRQQAAAAAAKAAADAEAARQQHAQDLKTAESSLDQTQTALDKARNSEKARQAAEEAARIQAQREADTARLTAQAAAAAKAAADAQKALEAAKQAVAAAEAAQAAAEQQAAAARSGMVPLPTGGPSPEEAASPTPAPAPAPSAPAATPLAGASASPAAAQASPQASPTLSVHAPNPNLKVDQALNNSLGMRFAPVGKVLFSIWLTRVQDFDAFAKATGFSSSAWQNPGFKQAPDHPVVNVSWNDANQFCLWLTEKEHHEGILAVNETYRLPTDIEWSNAVGLPPETGHTPESRDMDVPDVYPWGAQWPPPPGAGNYTGEETDSDVAIKGYNDGFAWTSPVGSFNANKFGLFDMGGNVWEWCGDWWNSEQKAKVLRGASWYNGALKLSLLSSCRSQAGADQRSDNYGFRVVIAEEMKKPRSAKPGPSRAKPR